LGRPPTAEMLQFMFGTTQFPQPSRYGHDRVPDPDIPAISQALLAMRLISTLREQCRVRSHEEDTKSFGDEGDDLGRTPKPELEERVLVRSYGIEVPDIGFDMAELDSPNHSVSDLALEECGDDSSDDVEAECEH
jgi:hypothetical protein